MEVQCTCLLENTEPIISCLKNTVHTSLQLRIWQIVETAATDIKYLYDVLEL